MVSSIAEKEVVARRTVAIEIITDKLLISLLLLLPFSGHNDCIPTFMLL